MHSSGFYEIYTHGKNREHLMCYEGKLKSKIFLHSKNVLTKLLNRPNSEVSKVASS